MRSTFAFAGWCCWCLLLAHGCTSDGSGAQGPTSEECADACARIAAADCRDIGSECFDQCIMQGTGDYGRPECKSEIADYQSCFYGAASYTCEEGQTRPLGCDDEQGALTSCLEPTGAGGAGDGGAAGGSGVDGLGDAGGAGGESG
jgi:hypothetical protein